MGEPKFPSALRLGVSIVSFVIEARPVSYQPILAPISEEMMQFVEEEVVQLVVLEGVVLL